MQEMARPTVADAVAAAATVTAADAAAAAADAALALAGGSLRISTRPTSNLLLLLRAHALSLSDIDESACSQ